MSGIWPDDIQCVALITFDVDGVSSWLRRNAAATGRVWYD